jgi:hypothetical protein
MSPWRPLLLSAVFGSTNWRRHGFFVPLRVGQASEALIKYAGLGPLTITQLAFRPGAQFGNAYGPVTDHGVRFDLSTTAAAPGTLSTTFANNVGPDDTVVFNGGWTNSSALANGPGNTKAFDLTLAFTAPFVYDPSKGDLLLDIRSPSPVDCLLGFTSLDAEEGAGTPVDSIFGFPSTSATRSESFGGRVIVQVTFTPAAPAAPEPASLTLLATGALGLLGYGWRKRKAARAAAWARPAAHVLELCPYLLECPGWPSKWASRGFFLRPPAHNGPARAP